MLFQQREQLFPQVHIQCRLLVRLDPAPFLPAVDPALGDAVHHVFAVRSQQNVARFFQGGQGFDDTGQFHAVVGGFVFAAGEFLFRGAVPQDRSPAARSGVATACSVCEDLYCFHMLPPCIFCIGSIILYI